MIKNADPSRVGEFVFRGLDSRGAVRRSASEIEDFRSQKKAKATERGGKN